MENQILPLDPSAALSLVTNLYVQIAITEQRVAQLQQDLEAKQEELARLNGKAKVSKHEESYTTGVSV